SHYAALWGLSLEGSCPQLPQACEHPEHSEKGAATWQITWPWPDQTWRVQIDIGRGESSPLRLVNIDG
ncbi:unnamed protein product, partial [marine sediment metagenome]